MHMFESPPPVTTKKQDRIVDLFYATDKTAHWMKQKLITLRHKVVFKF